jgi:hypothetical protein
MITSYVYYHKNKIDGTFYIGYRMRNVGMGITPEIDLTEYICSAPLVKEQIITNRNLWESNVICCFYNPTDAYDFEQKLIGENWKDPLLLNEHYFENGVKRFRSIGPMSTDHKLKISNSLKTYTRTPAHRIAISKSLTGRKLAKKSVDKRTATVTGTKRTQEQCDNISAGLIGHIVTAETRKKISISNTGKSHPKGKDSPCSKSIKCVTTNQIFSSQPEAALHFGIRQGDINNVLKGRQKTVKGLIFTYC